MVLVLRHEVGVGRGHAAHELDGVTRGGGGLVADEAVVARRDAVEGRDVLHARLDMVQEVEAFVLGGDLTRLVRDADVPDQDQELRVPDRVAVLELGSGDLGLDVLLAPAREGHAPGARLVVTSTPEHREPKAHNPGPIRLHFDLAFKKN